MSFVKQSGIIVMSGFRVICINLHCRGEVSSVSELSLPNAVIKRGDRWERKKLREKFSRGRWSITSSFFQSKWCLLTCGRVPTPASCNYFPLDKNSCAKTLKLEHCLCANQLQPWFKRGFDGIQRWYFPVREKHEIRRRRCYVNFINQPRPHPVGFRHHTCLMKEQLISPARRFPS